MASNLPIHPRPLRCDVALGDDDAGGAEEAFVDHKDIDKCFLNTSNVVDFPRYISEKCHVQV
ncbi:MAG: hypothetical protein V1721_09660 [Pseudomonadota bacterium]